jgi:transposase
VFQVHGVDEAGQPALRRKLRRAEVLRLFCRLEPALVGIEACHTAHHWAREIAALGHEVRLMPPLTGDPVEQRFAILRGIWIPGMPPIGSSTKPTNF